MAGKGSAPGERRGGRSKGTPNKTTALAKDIIAQVAQGLGGTEGMLAWAQEAPRNKEIFYGQIFTKLIPVQLSGEGGGPMVVELVQFANKTAGK